MSANKRAAAATLDEKPIARLARQVTAHGALLSCLLLALGAVGLAAAPLLAKATFFDENALLPGAAALGVVQGGLRAHGSSDFMARARQRLQGGSWLGWLAEEMSAAGLDSQVVSRADQESGCALVAGVLRPARADGKEALVLVTPVWAGELSGADVVALGAVHSLAGQLASEPWLSKNLIWLAPPGRCGPSGHGAVADWLARYYGLPGGAANTSMHRAGRIQQAIVLDMPPRHAGAFDAFEVHMQGPWGELPNLDLVHLTAWAARQYTGRPVGLPMDSWAEQLVLDASLALQTAGYGPLAAPHAAFLGRLARLAGFLGLQLSGQPLGAHAAFRSYGADAVSLRPVLLAQGQSVGRGVRRASGADAALELAKVLEVCVHSLSNLLEAFHHSSNMYAMLGVGEFVKAEVYIVPLAALLAAFCIQASALKSKATARQQDASPAAKWLAATVGCAKAHLLAVCLSGGLWAWASGALARQVALLVGDAPLAALAEGAAPPALLLGAAGAMVVGGLPARASVRRTKVVALTVLAAEGAAVGCANWVVSYAVALSLAPAALSAAPWRRPKQAGRSRGMASIRWLSLFSALLSPLLLGAALCLALRSLSSVSDAPPVPFSAAVGYTQLLRSTVGALPETAMLCACMFLPSWLAILMIGLSTDESSTCST
eukprot:jgi/Tetstr1/440560/TSEL_028881.t1